MLHALFYKSLVLCFFVWPQPRRLKIEVNRNIIRFEKLESRLRLRCQADDNVTHPIVPSLLFFLGGWRMGHFTFYNVT